MSSLEREALGRALKMAQMSVKNAMEVKFRTLGLTLSQFAVLSQLGIKEGQTNADLARSAFITPQSMQGVLSNLENAGFISRTADQEHGRRQPARLTAAGVQILAAAREASREVEEKLEAAVYPLDPDAALAMFERINHSLSGVK